TGSPTPGRFPPKCREAVRSAFACALVSEWGLCAAAINSHAAPGSSLRSHSKWHESRYRGSISCGWAEVCAGSEGSACVSNALLFGCGETLGEWEPSPSVRHRQLLGTGIDKSTLRLTALGA